VSKIMEQAVLDKLELLNLLPPEPVNKETYFIYQKEALIRIAESNLPEISRSVSIEMYLRSANLLLKQAKVYEAGGIKGPITDRQLCFVLTCRYHFIFSKLLDHPGFQTLERC
jgi:hypothetical protein